MWSSLTTYKTMRFRSFAAGLLVAACILGPAAPVLADPAVPTDYRSIVDQVLPAVPWMRISVVGGDAFLQLHDSLGHEVLVSGYWAEPYLRFDSDGSVWVNDASPTTTQNEARYGVAGTSSAGTSSAGTDVTKYANWRRVADGGFYAWHDHRVHWMSTLPAPIQGPQRVVNHWSVDLVVDGRAVRVLGTLYRDRAPTNAWWLVIPAAAIVALVFRHRLALVAAVAATISAALLVFNWLSLPAFARPAPISTILVALALAAVLPAVIKRRAWWSNAFVAGSGISLVLAGWVDADALTHLSIPGSIPAEAVRTSVGACLGMGLVVAAYSAVFILPRSSPVDRSVNVAANVAVTDSTTNSFVQHQETRL